jgi:chromosome segregation ATPase
MADILEDQRIHNIVKDYKRMYEQHDQLVAIGKQLQQELIAKDKELLRVRTELNNIKAKGLPDDKPIKAIKSQLSELETRVNSTAHNILIATQRLEGIKDNIKQIRELLKL